ncbi:MAG: hypothetical protein PHE89_04375 [Alphaproteobacteria bacterium]|nr:hypothetical protein [Alphaproteobacteria bacterium]
MSITSTSKVSGGSSLKSGNIRNARANNRRDEEIESVETADAVSADVGIQKENEQSFDTFHKEKQHKQEELKDDKVTYAPQATLALTTLEALEVFEETNQDTPTPNTNSKVGVYGNNQQIIRKERNPNDNYAKHFFEKNEIIEEVDEFA